MLRSAYITTISFEWRNRAGSRRARQEQHNAVAIRFQQDSRGIGSGLQVCQNPKEEYRQVRKSPFIKRKQFQNINIFYIFAKNAGFAKFNKYQQ
jgi:hypothetical protein